MEQASPREEHLKKPHRLRNVPKEQAIVDMFQAGTTSVADIAEACVCSISHVYNVLDRYGVKEVSEEDALMEDLERASAVLEGVALQMKMLTNKLLASQQKLNTGRANECHKQLSQSTSTINALRKAILRSIA